MTTILRVALVAFLMTANVGLALAQTPAPAPAPAATPAPASAPAPARPKKAAKTASAPAAAAPAPASPGSAVFPTAIADKYAKETPGKARMHTCLDQYHANKATNGNGGLKWIQKGGGYYSACSAKLKG